MIQYLINLFKTGTFRKVEKATKRVTAIISDFEHMVADLDDVAGQLTKASEDSCLEVAIKQAEIDSEEALQKEIAGKVARIYRIKANIKKFTE